LAIFTAMGSRHRGDADWSGERASDGGGYATSGLTVGFPQGLDSCDAHCPCTTTVTGTTANNWNLDWFATLRARLGLVADQTWLFYGTGGVAFAGVHFANGSATTTTITNSIGQIVNPVTGAAGGSPASVAGGAGETTTQVGFAVGAGVEKMFAQNWSIKVEYLFMDFGSHTFLAGTGLDTNIRMIDNVIRGGVNYKF
jgi:outer membrane immunogenic protein